MAISPGALIAIRRAIEAGGEPTFAPAPHLTLVALAVVAVPVSLAVLSAVFQKDFAISPLDVARAIMGIA